MANAWPTTPWPFGRRSISEGSEVTVKGWVRTRHDSKAGLSFVNVSDGSCFDPIQVVAPNTLANYADEIAKLTSENSRIVRAMWWSTLVDQGILREWVLNVGRRDAYERVSHLLCEFHFRMKRVGLVEDGRLALPLTQQELADATGLTAVHMNRTLQRLEVKNSLR